MYSEMLIQFGYVTFFAAAFPLAPLIAIFINVLEIKYRVYAYLYVIRRPLTEAKGDIGPWFNIWTIMGYLAIITNFLLLYM